MEKPRKTVALIGNMWLIALLVACGHSGQNFEEYLGQGDYLGEYWPTEKWRSCRPEAVEMDSTALAHAIEYAANEEINTHGIIIIRKGYIVAEAYFRGHTARSRFRSYSVAKSFMSACIGIAIELGSIGAAADLASTYLTEWAQPSVDERKQRITVAHLLGMSSGLQWNEEEYYGDTSANDVFIMAQSEDYLQYTMAKASESEPGTKWYYSSGDSMLLSGVLQRARGETSYEFAMRHLLTPIGAQAVYWDSDLAGHTIGGWGITATVRDYARFGYLYLRGGRWDDRQVVPDNWVKRSTTPVRPDVPWYGYQWWLAPVLGESRPSTIPDDLFIAWGIYTQQIFVLPSAEIAIVRTGNDPGSDDDEWDEIEFLSLVLEAIID